MGSRIIMIRRIFYYVIFALYILLWKGLTLADEQKCVSFDATKSQCEINEVCLLSVCQCKPGFTRLNNVCAKNSSNSIPNPAPRNDQPDANNSKVAVAIIIPIILILFVIGTVVLGRKYNIVSWIRNKINQRQTPYDEVMIGQDDDDPPLVGV